MHEMPEHVQRLLHYLSVDIVCRVKEVGDYAGNYPTSYVRWLINPWDCFPATTASLLIMRYHHDHGPVIFMTTIGTGTLLLYFERGMSLDFTLAPVARLNCVLSRQNSWQNGVHWQTNAWFAEQVNSFSEAWRPAYFFGAAL